MPVPDGELYFPLVLPDPSRDVLLRVMRRGRTGCRHATDALVSGPSQAQEAALLGQG